MQMRLDTAIEYHAHDYYYLVQEEPYFCIHSVQEQPFPLFYLPDLSYLRDSDGRLAWCYFGQTGGGLG